MTPSPSYRDKDDFGRPKPLNLQTDNWRSTIRFRRKRRSIFVFLAICTIIYLFLHSKWWNGVLLADGPAKDHATTPATTPKDTKFSSAPPSHNAVPIDPSLKPTDPNASKFIYNGPIRFLGLYETLSKIQIFNSRLRDKHVVFVAANMNTASILAGVACEMSILKKNVVHLALVGRNELSIEFFKKANGMSGDGCGVIIHDARPDYASISTDERMGLSLRSGLKYIREYITPTVFISDMDREDLWFQKSIVQKAKELSITHIKLPHDVSTIPWFQRLDSVSLSSWDKPLIDIVIHADAHSGQLIRLLKSLKNADYFTAPLPRLYIDLNPDTDQAIREFVDSFTWPSKDRLVVRHRITPRPASLDVDPAEFVESFYPNSKDSSVLFLSSNIELSPFYYQFLFYSILEYKYSRSQFALDNSLIYGISLDAPLSQIDGKPFDAKALTASSEKGQVSYSNPYLYAAPTTHATLFFGTHWRLLHLYIARRMDKASTKEVDYTTPTTISESFPHWAKYLVELLTAGGYLMLYPNFDPSDSLAVYHTETESTVSATSKEKGVMRVNNIVNYLPGGMLPLWSSLPIIGMDGTKTNLDGLLSTARDYKKKILEKCGGLKKDDGVEDSVDDLFCDGDEGVREKQRLERLNAAKLEKEEAEEEEAKEEEAKKLKEEKEKVLRSERVIREKERRRQEKVKKEEDKRKVDSEKGKTAGNNIEREDAPPKAGKLETDAPKVVDGRPKIIPHKILSLDDLDNVPVEVNGEIINVKGA